MIFLFFLPPTLVPIMNTPSSFPKFFPSSRKSLIAIVSICLSCNLVKGQNNNNPDNFSSEQQEYYSKTEKDKRWVTTTLSERYTSRNFYDQKTSKDSTDAKSQTLHDMYDFLFVYFTELSDKNLSDWSNINWYKHIWSILIDLGRDCRASLDPKLFNSYGYYNQKLSQFIDNPKIRKEILFPLMIMYARMGELVISHLLYPEVKEQLAKSNVTDRISRFWIVKTDLKITKREDWYYLETLTKFANACKEYQSNPTPTNWNNIIRYFDQLMELIQDMLYRLNYHK